MLKSYETQQKVNFSYRINEAPGFVSQICFLHLSKTMAGFIYFFLTITFMAKIKIYLDTNTILDVFINQAMHFKGKELRMPEKAKFMLDNIEKFEFNRDLVEIAIKTKLRLRTMFNFQHLFIAMKENAYIISGDKNFIEKSRELHLYDKLISYIEFRQMISNVS